jgi:hypothetical protein
MATPIDNADKKTFFQWIVGKGTKYVALELFIWIFYIFCSTLGIIQYVNKSGDIDTTGLILFLSILKLMFWINLFKTYQNYTDDKKGITS